MIHQILKTKICLIGDSLSDGGAERVMADLSKYFFSKGIDVHIVIIQDKITYPYHGKLFNLGVYKKPGIVNKVKRFFSLRNYLLAHQFNFVIDFRFKNNYLQEWITNELLYKKNKIVFTIHSFVLRYYIPENQFLSNIIFRKAYGIVVVSEKIKEAVKKREIQEDIKKIYNPLDTEYIHERLNEPHIAFDFKYILAAGRMNDDIKQFDSLIESYSRTILPKNNIKLVILGEGILKDIYLQQSKDLGLESMVIFPGFQLNPYNYMKNALFFVLSSKMEGLGMVLLESLACGTPVVSFDCNAGPSEIIQHKQNGLLIKDQDFEELTKGMNLMFQDKELYQKCKTNAISSIEKFRLENIGKQWLDYLKINS